MNNKDKKSIIKRLLDKKEKIYHSDIPEEYQNDKEIIKAERQAGIREIENIGFDVIIQRYFVYEKVLNINFLKEELWEKKYKEFKTFDEYYDYLDGNIYDNACYYQCDLSSIKKKIDKSKLSTKAFITDSIDDYNVIPSDEEITVYHVREQNKKLIKKWINKFVECDTLEKLQKTITSYNKSVLFKQHSIQVSFFLWNYIFHDINDKNRFNVIMKYISTGDNFYANNMIKPICHVYNANDVLANYRYSNASSSTCYKYRKELKDYVKSIHELSTIKKEVVLFDDKTHYYCVKNSYGVCRYFETFDELLKYRNNDLSNAVLTDDIKLDYDFSKCKMNENTMLPITKDSDLRYEIIKEYSSNSRINVLLNIFPNIFRVTQVWYNKNNKPVKSFSHKFNHFFDFVAFLKGDLSGAELLLCDGLANLTDISGLNFTNAKLTSRISDMFGLSYDKYKVDTDKVESFKETTEYEKSTELVLQTTRELTDYSNYDVSDNYKRKIYYISDLHLLHKLEHYKTKSYQDVVYVFMNIINNILTETGAILLIGGDVSSDYTKFELFVKLLRKEIDKQNRNICVIFTLGNHELWDFPEFTFSQITEKYRELLSKYKMLLLQNDIIYYDSSAQRWNNIKSDEIVNLSKENIREKLRAARYIFFGGLAFSGCCESFNANNGIYRMTISREQEIEESKRFNSLYDKVVDIIPDRKLVVFTHTPMDCWRQKPDYHKDYIYVNGHTHKNYFYDDGEIRIYADNQVGYKNNNPHVKWLSVDNEYDYFSDYKDGIYQITGDEYRQFNRGKNINCTFNREVNILYMLKKNGFYCFIHQSKNGSLTMLNGGALKKLDVDDIQYYYNNMDYVIAKIKDPLDKYTNIQKKVATEICKIGGSGYIHGCIIDIDWYNHVYINPVDMKITGYWASDIINKRVYPNVPALLKKECPLLYSNYKKLLKGSTKNLPVLSKGENKDMSGSPKAYLYTDIYRASREIRKMQKLSSNILTTWYEIDSGYMMLESDKG